MRKFKLHLDDLRIDSFATAPVQKTKGTVFGKQYTYDGTCNEATCGDGFTCLWLFTCENTGCNYSCNGCGETMNTAQGYNGGQCGWCP